MTVLSSHIVALDALEPREIAGTVASVRGLGILVDDLPLPVGALVRLEMTGNRMRHGEVVGFDGGTSIVMLLGSSDGVAPGARVVGAQSAQTVQVGAGLLGRVIDGLGRPIDGDRPVGDTVTRWLDPPPVPALDRGAIDAPLPTGVRVIDGMTTIGRGQRVGVFSGPGVGKSTLLATIARNTAADVNVIALIGERGREVREFLDRTLDDEGRARSVVVVATADESPLLRVRASLVACTVAEHFRAVGANVMLMIDSMTRIAHAQRQIGLAAGEHPATRGYPPSVFAMIPRILERAGCVDGEGSITGIYAVLVEGDDLAEPVADTARGVLDGHLALSRTLASRGHHPAIDLRESISRVADDVCDPAHVAARQLLLRLIAAHAEVEELVRIGAYVKGTSAECDVAIDMKDRIDAFLRQTRDDAAAYPGTCRAMLELAEEAARRLRTEGAT